MIFTRDGREIDYSRLRVEVDVSSSEVVRVKDGTPAYKFYHKVLHDPAFPENSRVKLMVIGPEEAIYSRQFEDSTKLKLCTVYLIAESTSVILPNMMD